MNNKLSQLLFLFMSVFFLTAHAFAAEKTLNIVATQTIFADLIKQVGKDKVIVTAIASPKYNIHFIQPKPSDVRKVAKADLYFNAGMDLEAWSDPLLEAAGQPQLFRNGSKNVDLSSGIRLLDVPQTPVSRSQGDIHLFGNPHFQMNPANAIPMVQIILAKLKEEDPENASYYENNAKAFLEKLNQKIAEWKNLCSSLKGKEIISYHADIAYFADFLGLKAEQFLEPKPGIPPTPKHLEFLEKYAKEHHIHAIVMPTYFQRDAANELAHRINAKVVTIAQGVGEVPDTDDFFSFFDYNFKQISEGSK